MNPLIKLRQNVDVRNMILLFIDQLVMLKYMCYFLQKYCTPAPQISIIYKWYRGFQNLLECDTLLSEEHISDLAYCVEKYILSIANYCTLEEEFTEKNKRIVAEILCIIPVSALCY